MVEQPVPELFGVSEAAECLGVATGNLGKVPGLPAPAITLRAGKFYLATEIRALAESRRARAEGKPDSERIADLERELLDGG
jgi:hypothetical protein